MPVVTTVELAVQDTSSTELNFQGIPGVNLPNGTQLSFVGTVQTNGTTTSEYAFEVSSGAIVSGISNTSGVVTIKAGSVFYVGNNAVIISETYNGVYAGDGWKTVTKAEKLTAGYTQADLVQFTNVYDFGLTAEGPLEFSGSVLLDGVEVVNSTIVGYAGNSTVCLKVAHEGKILTVAAGSVIHSGDEAVVITEDFSAIWNGTGWVKAKISDGTKEVLIGET